MRVAGGILDGDITNVGDGIVVLDGGTLTTTIIGGTIKGTGGTAGETSILDGVTLATSLTAQAGFGVTIHNGLTLKDDVVLTVPFHAFGPSQVLFDGTQTLGGTGEVRLTGGALRPTTGTLTIGPDIRIHTTIGGTLGGAGALLNEGRIVSDQAGRTVTVTGSTVTNEGTLEATGWGTLSVNNLQPNTGVISAGIGGLVTIAGNFTNATTGKIAIVLGGTLTSRFGRVSVSGAATLGGAIDVSLGNGFTPGVGNTFDAMTFASHTGTFDQVNVPAPLGGVALQVVPESTRVRVAAVAVPGPTVAQLDAFAGPAAVSQPTQHMPTGVKSRGRLATWPNSPSLINWNADPPKRKQVAPVHRATIQQPTWVRDFLLELAQDDPNRDLRVELPLAAPLGAVV